MNTASCTCPRARHDHGDSVMYVHHKCRCAVCKAGNRDRERARARAKLYGRNRLTDAEPARVHVRELMAAGMGIKRIAEVAGMTGNRIGDLLYGRGGKDPRPPRKQISTDLEAKILAVKLDLADGANTDNLGPIRRLRALVAMGWSQSRLAQRLGMDPTNFGRIIHGDRFEILVSTAKRVEALFDELWDQAPPAETHRQKISVSRSKAYAKSHGWAPPAAWDDMDDPLEKPKHNLEDSIPARSRALVEKIDRLELLIHDGYGDNDDTFVRAGWGSQNSGYVTLRRAGREDLIDRLRRNDLARQVAS